MRTWLQDVRYAWRMLRKNVLFDLLIFSFLGHRNEWEFSHFQRGGCASVRPALLYPQPERLAAVVGCIPPAIGIFPATGLRRASSSTCKMRTILQFQQMALSRSRPFTLTGREQAELVDDANAIQFAGDARRKSFSWPSLVARGGRARETGGRYSERPNLEASV